MNFYSNKHIIFIKLQKMWINSSWCLAVTSWTQSPQNLKFEYQTRRVNLHLNCHSQLTRLNKLLDVKTNERYVFFNKFLIYRFKVDLNMGFLSSPRKISFLWLRKIINNTFSVNSAFNIWNLDVSGMKKIFLHWPTQLL